MVELHERAKEKLGAYRDEAALRRGLPTGLWRVRLAAVLRTLAERLEPATLLTTTDQGRA